jgi:hypothetical protein
MFRQEFVKENIRSVQKVHEAIFALALVVILAFQLLLLRPFMQRSDQEAHRIAELLSQLPPEVAACVHVRIRFSPCSDGFAILRWTRYVSVGCGRQPLVISRI